MASACKETTDVTDSMKEMLDISDYKVSTVSKTIHDLIDSKEIEEFYKGIDSSYDSKVLINLYKGDNPKPIWINGDGVSAKGMQLLSELKNIDDDGLKPKDYLFDSLNNIQAQIKSKSVGERKLAVFELMMSYAFERAGKHLLMGKLVPLKLNEEWQNTNDSIWDADSSFIRLENESVSAIYESLRPAHPWYKRFREVNRALKELGTATVDFSDIPANIQIGDSALSIPVLRRTLKQLVGRPFEVTSDKWDSNIEGAIKAYQKKNDLAESGKFDSQSRSSLIEKVDVKKVRLALNMERLRWLKKDFYEEFIWVNIPQMMVEYFEQDSVTFSMRSVVGRLSRKTPTLDSRMTNIVFNPPWYIPPTIMKEEIVPGIARRGGSYLTRRGLVATRGGRKVNPSRINKGNYMNYAVMQKPGRNSALGSVKFNFPNFEAIFLHDTNHRGDFGRKYRAKSSGCIRVQHPRDFAEFMLRDSTYSLPKIDKIIKRKNTQSVKVKRDIGVHIVYLTNAVDSQGNVVQVNDLYKWDKEMYAYF